MANQYINLRQAEQVFDVSGEPINYIDWNAYPRDASQWSTYSPLPADNYSRIADNYPVMPFMGAPAVPQMPFVSPVPSFGDDDANHDGLPWPSQCPLVPEPYASAPLSLPLSPSPPPSPSPTDLALSDYEPSPPWTQTVAHQHLAPLTAFAVVDRYGGADTNLAPHFLPVVVVHLAPLTSAAVVNRYAREQRAPPFWPRYFVPAEKSPLPPLRPAPPTQARWKRPEVAVPARPARVKRKRSVNARADMPPLRPAPALRKGKSDRRTAAPQTKAKAAAPRAAAAPACKCDAAAAVIHVDGGSDDADDDDDDSEFDSGSEIGEPDSDYEETGPRRRR